MKQKKLIRTAVLAVFFTVFFSVKVYADVLIFVASPLQDSQQLNAELLKNVKTLEKQTKKAGIKFVALISNKVGFFLYKKPRKTYENLYEALFSQIKKIPENQKIYLIFAGHSDDEQTFLITENKTYTIDELIIFLSTLKRRLYLIGFDVCQTGNIKNLKKFSSFSKIVIGTAIDEPFYGWHGIYQHFAEIAAKGFQPSIALKYFLSFYRQKMKENRQAFKDSDLSCASLNIFEDDVLTAGAVCLY